MPRPIKNLVLRLDQGLEGPIKSISADVLNDFHEKCMVSITQNTYSIAAANKAEQNEVR